jgi:L-lactate permease
MRRNLPFALITVLLTGILVILVYVESPAIPYVVGALVATVAVVFVSRTFLSPPKKRLETKLRAYREAVIAPAETTIELHTGLRRPSYSPDEFLPTMSVLHDPSPEALDLDRLEQERRMPER